jgi:hypothetical protein
MKKLIIGLLLLPNCLMCTEEKWIEHTYRNELDNPVKIITQYTQLTQRFVQPRKRRKLVSKKVQGRVVHTIDPHESRTIAIKGDAFSAHRIIPGSIKVFDIHEHDHAIVPKYNVQNRYTFVVSRNKRDKLTMQSER